MGIDDLLRHYTALPAHERAVFAAMVRAHGLFNTPDWRSELARRHQAVESGKGVRMVNASELIPPPDSTPSGAASA